CLEQVRSRRAAAVFPPGRGAWGRHSSPAQRSAGMAGEARGRQQTVQLTGGMAHSKRVVAWLRGYLEWIAPVRVYPGEDELQALAEGVFRVLDGEEKAKHLWEEGRNPAEAAAIRE